MSAVYLLGGEPGGCLGCLSSLITTVVLLVLLVIIGAVFITIFGPILLIVWIGATILGSIF